MFRRKDKCTKPGIAVVLLLVCLVCTFHYVMKGLNEIPKHTVLVTNTPTMSTRKMSIQDSRKMALRSACQNSTDTGYSPGQIIVDDRHKILVCWMPKVACTNIKKLMVKYSPRPEAINKSVHIPEEIARTGLTLFHKLSKQRQREVIKNYYKIMFVRHPMERLLSAYRDKFEHTLESPNDGRKRYFHLPYGRQIIQKFRQNATTASLENGNDVTFNEFISYIIHLKKNGLWHEPHWSTYTNLCHPCSLKYNFIGKLETVDKDMDYIIENVYKDPDVSRKERFNKRYANSTKEGDTMQRYYSKLPREQFDYLTKALEAEVKMFGYEPFQLN